MRVSWLMGLMAMAVALPLGAQADASRATPTDLWVSAGARDTASWSRSTISVSPRGSIAAGVERPGPLFRGAPPPPVNSVPEVNRGLAAAGLTLLLGGIALLRGRRSRM